jgi:hypothetical protein
VVEHKPGGEYFTHITGRSELKDERGSFTLGRLNMDIPAVEHHDLFA